MASTSSARSLLASAFLSGAIVALVDVDVSARQALWWRRVLPVLPSGPIVWTAAALAGCVFLAVLLGAALSWPLRRRSSASGPWTAALCAPWLLLGLAFACGLVEIVSSSDEAWAYSALLAAVWLSSGPVAYGVARGLQNAPRVRAWILGLFTTAPLALLCAWFAMGIEQRRHLGVRSIGFVLLWGGWLAVWWFTSAASRREEVRVRAERAWLAVAVAWVAAAVTFGTRPRFTFESNPASSTPHAVPRVLLISIDTLRRDALSCYGNPEPSPSIDALARDGVQFDAAQAQAPWTLLSVASLLTGLSVNAHQVVHVKGAPFARLKPLPERLALAGYRTASTGNNAFLSGHHGNMDGVQRGVEEDGFAPRRPKILTRAWRAWSSWQPRVSMLAPNTDDLADSAIDWIQKNRSAEWFLWVHFLDPHGPFEPPARYAPASRPTKLVGETYSPGEGDHLALEYSPEDMARVRSLYQAEVRWVDDCVGRILETLRQLGQYDDTLIVLTADHGDEFLEHGDWGHGQSLYRELLDVPLVFKLPKSSARGHVSERVSLDCVLPTVLELCDVPYDPEELTGVSLVRAWSGGPAPEHPRPLFATGIHDTPDLGARCVVFGNVKYVRELRSGREMVFDLAQDPTEQVNLASSRADWLEQGRALLQLEDLRTSEVRARRNLEKGEGRGPDPEVMRVLHGLGYF